MNAGEFLTENGWPKSIPSLTKADRGHISEWMEQYAKQEKKKLLERICEPFETTKDIMTWTIPLERIRELLDQLK